MAELKAAEFFDSEASWPFILREKAMADSLDFLASADVGARRSLRIFGESGSGKSFFVRDLICRLSQLVKPEAALYLDFPPSDLDASNVLRSVDSLISQQRSADRSVPQFVSASLATNWLSKKRQPRNWQKSYTYSVARELSAQIPIVGPFIKAVLPSSLPVNHGSEQAEFAALRYLVKRSHNASVILALDNVQFIPHLLRELIERELSETGIHFRIVTIERVIGSVRSRWDPLPERCTQRDIDFTAASLPDVAALVKAVLPDSVDTGSLAEVIYRRSEGNLKSIWFQLKFIAERGLKAEKAQSTSSYEGAIRSLDAVEQTVLRLVVFLLGGLSIDQVLNLFRALDLGIEPTSVTKAIAGLSAFGLLVVNSERRNKVRVEHEIVARVVTALTPEEEKVEFRQQLLEALMRVLDSPESTKEDATLYDRLLGIAHEREVRSNPGLQAHIVSFVGAQHLEERFAYLTTVLRDSVCWDVIDVLPARTVEMLLNSLQRCSLFSFGLVAVEKLRKSSVHQSLASLYEAKYLAQLFRYEEALSAMSLVPASNERALVTFNIMINQCEDEAAARVAHQVYSSLSNAAPSEHELVILRNAGHLFDGVRSRAILTTAAKGFRRIGSKFGVATSLNNLGIAELMMGDLELARSNLSTARRLLDDLGSPEVYQPLVNLSALALVEGIPGDARPLLHEAKRSVPRSLLMDRIMLDYNAAVLDLLESNKTCGENEVLAFQALHHSAAKTKDLRFIDTLGWFVSRLEHQVRGVAETEFSSQIVARVLSPDTVGLEIFLKLGVENGESISAPYMLSPHWRY